MANSHLVSINGSNVVWIPGGDDHLVAKHCVFEAMRTDIVFRGAAERRESPAAAITLQDNSFSASVALHLMMDIPMRSFNVISQRNAFDTPAFLRIAARPQIWNSKPIPRLFSRLNWIESKNGYRRGTLFIRRGRHDENRPEFVIEPALSGWLATCGNPNAESFETEFRPRDEQIGPDSSDPDPLANVRIAPATVPWPIGADLSRVGPSLRTGQTER